ncbi:tail fiber protein [Parasalinivibrio latis]|uniref:phage tail protein n=1 Tax=Parasalinivibrio latis TaxID=2952610 RepID=UPI0030E54F72
MSNTLTPVVTSAGLNAVFNAQSTGLDATIIEIALGDAAWTPDNTATTLQNEKRRITVSGERVSDSQIHLTGVEDGTDLEYWVREVGFYLADGTLLAIWINANQALAYKSAGVDLLLAFDLVLSALPANSVTVDGSAGFNLPPATGSKRGLVRIATQAEVEAGISEDVVITPAQLYGQLSLSSPVGTVIAFAANTPPGGFIECNGAALSRSAYAELFTTISTAFGAGDGTTTFNLPDFRGEFLRGWDHERGVDTGRGFGTSQGDAIRNIYGNARFGNNVDNMGVLIYETDGAFHAGGYNRVWYQGYNGNGIPRDSAQWLLFNASRVVPTAEENRPRNSAIMYCIKY